MQLTGQTKYYLLRDTRPIVPVQKVCLFVCFFLSVLSLHSVPIETLPTFVRNKSDTMTRRKKPPPQHSKRRQITDSAGWTHVIKGPPGTIHHPTSTASHLELGGKPTTETGYTLETYLDRFRNHYVPIWKGSPCFENLSRILEREMLPSSAAQKNDVVVTRCVCLGLGSMTAGSESSSYELAALMSMLEILGRSDVCSIMEMFPPTQTQIYMPSTLQRKKNCHLFKLPPLFTPRVFQKPHPPSN